MIQQWLDIPPSDILVCCLKSLSKIFWLLSILLLKLNLIKHFFFPFFFFLNYLFFVNELFSRLCYLNVVDQTELGIQ
jgi:hypothetical protein